MSNASSTPTTTTDIHDESLYECPVCFNEYTDSGEHEPIILQPCGHGCCRDCYGTMIVKNKQPCPTCRTPITVSAQPIVNYPFKKIITDRKNNNTQKNTTASSSTTTTTSTTSSKIPVVVVNPSSGQSTKLSTVQSPLSSTKIPDNNNGYHDNSASSIAVSTKTATVQPTVISSSSSSSHGMVQSLPPTRTTSNNNNGNDTTTSTSTNSIRSIIPTVTTTNSTLQSTLVTPIPSTSSQPLANSHRPTPGAPSLAVQQQPLLAPQPNSSPSIIPSTNRNQNVMTSTTTSNSSSSSSSSASTTSTTVPSSLPPFPVLSGRFNSLNDEHASTDCLYLMFCSRLNSATGCPFRHVPINGMSKDTMQLLVESGTNTKLSSIALAQSSTNLKNTTAISPVYCRDWCVRRTNETGPFCPRGSVCPFLHPHRRIVQLTDCPDCLRANCSSSQNCLYTKGLPSTLRHITTGLGGSPAQSNIGNTNSSSSSNSSSTLLQHSGTKRYFLCNPWTAGMRCDEGLKCQYLHVMERGLDDDASNMEYQRKVGPYKSLI